jgi:GGDEF domain-containing protein
LFNGVTIVQKIINSQRDRRKTGGHGALMAVMLFESGALLAQLGHSGLDELYSTLAMRVRRHAGVVNPAGRYYDNCFVVLFVKLHSPRMMRTLGLRLAASLRQPVDVTTLSGERLGIRADIGVGIIQISEATTEVDDLLHDAQAAAMASRHMPSRAALLDPLTEEPLSVELAELGPRWKSTRSGLASAGKLTHPKSKSSRTRAA